MDIERVLKISQLGINDLEIDELCRVAQRKGESYEIIMGERYKYLDRICAVLEEGFTKELISTLLSFAAEPFSQNIIQKLKAQYGEDVIDNIRGYSAARKIEDVYFMQYYLFQLRKVGVPLDASIIREFYQLALTGDLVKRLPVIQFLDGEDILNDPMLKDQLSYTIIPNRFGAEICSNIMGILTSSDNDSRFDYYQLCFDFYNIVGQYCQEGIQFPEKLWKCLTLFRNTLNEEFNPDEIGQAISEAENELGGRVLEKEGRKVYDKYDSEQYEIAKSEFLTFIKLKKKLCAEDPSLLERFEKLMLEIFDELIKGYYFDRPETFSNRLRHVNMPLSIEEIELLEQELANYKLEDQKHRLYHQIFSSLEEWGSKIEKAYMNEELSLIEDEFVKFLQSLPLDEYGEFSSISIEIFSCLSRLSVECDDIDFVDEFVDNFIDELGYNEGHYELENKVSCLRIILKKIKNL